MLAMTGFLPGDDPRMKATIDATASADGAVHLRDPDGHALSLAPVG